MRRRAFLRCVLGVAATSVGASVEGVLGVLAPRPAPLDVLRDTLEFTRYLVGDRPILFDEYVLPAAEALSWEVDRSILEEMEVTSWNEGLFSRGSSARSRWSAWGRAPSRGPLSAMWRGASSSRRRTG